MRRHLNNIIYVAPFILATLAAIRLKMLFAETFVEGVRQVTPNNVDIDRFYESRGHSYGYTQGVWDVAKCRNHAAEVTDAGSPLISHNSSFKVVNYIVKYMLGCTLCLAQPT